jgi:hypothetical protein
VEVGNGNTGGENSVVGILRYVLDHDGTMDGAHDSEQALLSTTKTISVCNYTMIIYYLPSREMREDLRRARITRTRLRRQIRRTIRAYGRSIFHFFGRERFNVVLMYVTNRNNNKIKQAAIRNQG